MDMGCWARRFCNIIAYGPFAKPGNLLVRYRKQRVSRLRALNVYKIIYETPEQFIKRAQPNAEHLILTYSHKIDLEICDKILNHDFQWAGLIGSKTKFTRFKKKLYRLGTAKTKLTEFNVQ